MPVRTPPSRRARLRSIAALAATLIGSVAAALAFALVPVDSPAPTSTAAVVLVAFRVVGLVVTASTALSTAAAVVTARAGSRTHSRPMLRHTARLAHPTLRRVARTAFAVGLSTSAAAGAIGPVGAPRSAVTAPPSGPPASEVPGPNGDGAIAVRSGRAAAPQPQPTPGAPAPPAGSAAVTYRVVPGDNLWVIAAREVARRAGVALAEVPAAAVVPYWQAVCDTNRPRLASGDVGLIYPGEAIALPAETP